MQGRKKLFVFDTVKNVTKEDVSSELFQLNSVCLKTSKTKIFVR